MRKKAIIGTIISLAILIAMLLVIDYRQLGAALRRANYWYVLPYLVFVIFSMALRTWRWQLLVRPLGRVPFGRLYASTMIGFMANNVLPARLGEAVRAYSLGARTGLSRSAVFGTIIVERIYDSFTLLVILWLVFLFSQAANSADAAAVKSFGYVFLAINAALLVLLVFLQRKTTATLHWLGKMLRWLPERRRRPVREIIEKFARGLTLAPGVGPTIGIILYSVTLWVMMAVSSYLIFSAFGYSLSAGAGGRYLPMEATFVVLVVVSLAITVPSTPGYFGVFHAGVVLALKVYLNLPPKQFIGEAAAIAIVMHAANYVPITLLGFYHLKAEHLKFKTSGGVIDVQTAGDSSAAPPATDP